MSKLPRRSFLACAAAPFVFRGADARPAPSERITLGMIGVGSMGLRHVQGFLQEPDCQILCICDVDAARRRAAAEAVNKQYDTADCRQVGDFREAIADRGLDALVISIPDHWHAAASIPAVLAGKDVYGEKPLALTIPEGRAMVEAVRRAGIVWQMGSWQRSTTHFRVACELVRNGRIGKLVRVEVGLADGFRPQGAPRPLYRLDTPPPMPVPPGLDYEMWLGPAPWAPYTELRCHWNFRWILDYSGGQVTDDGAHQIDIAHWGMDADGTGPVEVEGTGEFPDGLWDAAARYRFACRYANGLVMDVASVNYLRGGTRFIGETGWIHVDRERMTASAPWLLKERIGPDEIHLASPAEGHRQGHRRDFLDCVRTRRTPITPIEIGHRSVAVAHLGNIAMLAGRKIRWDPAREEILGDPAAARMLHRPLREPWSYG